MPRLFRLAVPAVALPLLLVVWAIPAAAHVTVHADDPQQGASDVRLSFRVPNESDTAVTTKIQVFFPTDHPLVGVLTEPLPGWTATTTTGNLATPVKTDDGTITTAVTEVTWSGGKVPVGSFQDFVVDVGQLPDASSLTFKALQTYSDGHVVSWIETVPPGEPEPDFPAPVLSLTPAADAGANPAASSTGTTTPASKSTSDGTARTLAAVGIGAAVLLGGAGLAFGVAAWRRSGRPVETSEEERNSVAP